MKFLRITITSILLFIVLLKGLKIYKNFEISKDLKNEKINRLKNTAEVLSECFDLKNKSKRNLSDSIKLVEYCLKEYGTKTN